MSLANYMTSQEYLSYLVQNCGVRGYDTEARTPVCQRPDVEIILDYARWLAICPTDSLLEVGCGLGRILKELHDEYGTRPAGIDSFPEAIVEARKRVGTLCAALAEGSAETIPFPDAAFDKLVCWGVFDLTNQAAALREMARVLRVGGAMLLTGKNDLYHLDDEEAYLAECASQRKGIPNHYTDFDALLRWAAALGLAPERARYFPRRGDFMNDCFADERPARFYEYVVLFRKDRAADSPVAHPPLVGRDVSRAFAERTAAR